MTSTQQEVERLAGMTMPQLREAYAELFGEVTRSGNWRWLFRRCAWRVQALAEGGLPERVLRRALEMADDADARVIPLATRCPRPTGVNLWGLEPELLPRAVTYDPLRSGFGDDALKPRLPAGGSRAAPELVEGLWQVPPRWLPGPLRSDLERNVSGSALVGSGRTAVVGMAAPSKATGRRRRAPEWLRCRQNAHFVDLAAGRHSNSAT